MKILLSDVLYKKNISYRQASIMTGIPRSTLCDIAMGKVPLTLDEAESIAKGLKIHITDLFDSPYK